MKIKVLADRSLQISNPAGTQHENDFEIIDFEFPESLNNYNKKIVFTDIAENPVWDLIQNNRYEIKTIVSQHKTVKFYIWVTHETIDFRSRTYELTFYDNSDASSQITPEEINAVNEILAEVDEAIEEVENLNIDAEKTGTKTTITITDKQGQTKEVEILDGEKGDDGYTPQKGTDYWTEEDKAEMVQDTTEELTPLIPTKTSQLTNDSGFIDKDVNNLTNYELKTNTGSTIAISIDSSTYVVTIGLKNSAGTIISSGTIDLPLESVVVDGRYDNTTKSLILVLDNGNEVTIPIGDLVSGLVPTNRTIAGVDLVDNITKQELQNALDWSNKENVSNKVTSITSSSTNTQYPSAKAVYTLNAQKYTKPSRRNT